MAATATIAEELQLIRKDREAQIKLEKQVKHLSKVISASLERVRGALKNGSTTGDRVVDLVMWAGGSPFDPLLDKVRALDAALKGHSGEFVLVTFHDEVPHKHVFGKGYENRTARCYRLGVLSGEELTVGKDLFSDTALLFPVTRYVEGEHGLITERGDIPPRTVVEHHLFSQRLGGFRDGNPPRLLELIQHGWEDTLIIGDEPVKEWLTKHGMPGLYKPAAAALSKLILEPTDD